MDSNAFEDTAADSNGLKPVAPLPRVDGSLPRFRPSATIPVQAEDADALLATRLLSTLHGVDLQPTIVELLLAGQTAVASALPAGGLAGSGLTYGPASCRSLLASAWHAEDPDDSGAPTELSDTHSLILIPQVSADGPAPITVPSLAAGSRRVRQPCPGTSGWS